MLLKLENISKGFGDPATGNYRSVLDALDFSLDKGEIAAILGPSGSGKTTFLNIIGALESPDKGKVLFEERDITGLAPAELDRYRNQQIGFVFQFHHLLPQCTLMENVLIPTLMIRDKETRNEKRELAGQLLERVGLWDHRDDFPGTLSGGECQRAAVVRAIINQPSLLLADEPTGALDSGNVTALAELFLELNQQEGLTLLMVTHSRQLAEKMGTLYELRNGILNKS